MKLADETVSVAQIAKIGIEVLEGFQELHARKYCFVDVKPDNFMIKEDKLYFIDFGLIEKYVDISTGAHRPLQTSVQLVGTPTFSSLNRHAGYTHSRRDDIEAMCYMLLSLCSRGKLPWSVATSDSELHEMKKACDILSFCKKNGCDEIGEMIMKARAMDYDSEPNYEEFGSLLKKMATGGAKRKISSNSFDSSSGGKKVAKNHVKKAITGSKLSSATKDCRESNMNGSVGKKNVSTLGAQKKSGQKKEENKEEKTTKSPKERTKDNGFSLYWIVLEGAHAGEEYELKFGSFIESVGRGEENFVCLKKDEYVSEKHASLRLGDNNNTIEVKDNPVSTNKFKLNSVKFDDNKWHVMRVGDIIQFGLSKIRLISVEAGRRVTVV